MNIFVLDEDPRKAAQYHCDKHVVKMVLESAQMMCTILNELGVETPYKSTHKSHPSTVWAARSIENYEWLAQLGIELCREYTFRYGKEHKSQKIIEECSMKTSHLPSHPMTPFVTCMPREYKTRSAITSYRQYYAGEKVYMATWKKGRPEPKWWREYVDRHKKKNIEKNTDASH